MIQPGGTDPQTGRYDVPVCPLVEEDGTVIELVDLWGTRLEKVGGAWIRDGQVVPLREVVEAVGLYGARFASWPSWARGTAD